MILSALIALAATTQAAPAFPGKDKPVVIHGIWDRTQPVPARRTVAPGFEEILRLYPDLRVMRLVEYPIDVPPGARIKVELKDRQGNFRVRFLPSGETRDPGIMSNYIKGRYDAQFYENKSAETRRLWCLLFATRDNFDKEPYDLVFSTY